MNRVEQNRWEPFVARYLRGEWRTPIFRDMILCDVQRFTRAATFLDIGCGRGFDLEPRFQRQLSQRCLKYIGVEPDLSAAVPEHFHEVHRCSFEAAPLSPGTVDLAYAIMVLEHIEEPDQFWTKLWDVLRPGGVFWGFTVDARHYFALASYWMERAGLKGKYLRFLHSTLETEEFEHYPTRYLANSPRQITRFTDRFRGKDYVSFQRAGQMDYYLPSWLRPFAWLLDRGMIAVGSPGLVLAIRLEK